jgi:Rieske 2Fe-2S family protein
MPAPIDPKLLQPSLAEFRQSYTLPGEVYTSAELFAWEMRNFFEPSWVCLGRTEGLMRPNSRRALRVGAESILLTRDDAGVLRGFFNICRHRGHEILPAGGSAEGPLIECPYHGWTYRQDGSLKSAPRLGLRPGFEVADHGLTAVRVDEWEGWAFVNVSADARPLNDHLGNLAEMMSAWAPRDMVETSRMDYVVEANWKLIHENYQECYHCTAASSCLLPWPVSQPADQPAPGLRFEPPYRAPVADPDARRVPDTVSPRSGGAGGV